MMKIGGLSLGGDGPGHPQAVEMGTYFLLELGKEKQASLDKSRKM